MNKLIITLIFAADGVPANTTQPRWLNVALSGEEQVLPYTLTNAAAAPFSWTVRGLPSVGVSPGEPIPIGISVGPVPATGVRTALTGLIEKESMQVIAPKGLVLCPSGTTPCTSAFVDIPPNSPAELWLWGVDRVGKFEGSLIIASAEKPAGDSVAMTVYSTSLCYQIAGVVVIFLSVALSWLCTVFVRSRLDRAQLLLPAVMLRKSLDGLKTKIATMPAELKATNVSTTIGHVEQKLSDDQLEQVGLPGSTVAPCRTN